MKKLWQWLTTPLDNPWLALLAALIGALLLALLLQYVAPLLPIPK